MRLLLGLYVYWGKKRGIKKGQSESTRQTRCSLDIGFNYIKDSQLSSNTTALYLSFFYLLCFLFYSSN